MSQGGPVQWRPRSRRRAIAHAPSAAYQEDAAAAEWGEKVCASASREDLDAGKGARTSRWADVSARVHPRGVRTIPRGMPEGAPWPSQVSDDCQVAFLRSLQY